MTGTFAMSDLLAMKKTTVVDFGLDKMVEFVNTEVATHNSVVNVMLSELTTRTTERAGTSGATLGGRMVQKTETGRSATQKGNQYANVAYPLIGYEFSVGWTRTYFETKTVSDMALALKNSQKADILGIQIAIKNAIFGSINYTFIDDLKDNATLNVKRLVNADGDVITNSPVTGEAFNGSTHTHYDAVASLTAGAVEALIADVVEHGHGDDVRVYINKTQESAVRALTGFVALQPSALVLTSTQNQALERLDTTRVDNRKIGFFNGAEVWTKSWMPNNYLFAFSAGDDNKPLAFRESEYTALQGFRLAAELETHPLHSQFFERYFGIAVQTRTNGAVLYIGGGVYVDPT